MTVEEEVAVIAHSAVADAQSAPAPSSPPIRREILGVALPVAVGAVVWVGGQSVVGALLGHLPGDALYVRGLLLPVGFLFVALQEAWEVVAQVGAARLRGRGEDAALRGLMLRLCVVGWACFAVVGVLVAVLAPTVAALLRVPTAAAGDFVTVLRWTALVNVVGVPVNVMTALLRGGGRARGAAALSCSVIGVQVAGVWLLGLRGGLGVFSLPWAAAASVLGGLLLGGTLLLRSGLLRTGPAVTMTDVPSGPPVTVRALLLGIGLPVAASFVMLSANNLATEWVLAPFGTHVVAGFGAATAVQGVAIVPALALGTATAVTANRRWAAGEADALAAALRVGLRLALLGYLAIAALVLLGAGVLGGLMSADPATAAQLTGFLRVVGPSDLGLGLVLFLLTFLEQTGSGRIAVAVNLCAFASTLLVGGLLAHATGGPFALYATLAVANAFGVAVVLPLTRRRVARHGAAHGTGTGAG